MILDLTVDTRIETTDVSYNSAICGLIGGRGFYFHTQNGNISLWNNDGKEIDVANSIQQNTVHDVQASTTNDQMSITIDGVVYTENIVPSAVGSSNFSLFRHSANYRAKLKMYYFKLYDSSGILVRDYIPVRRDSDGVLGMYDLVNGVFYSNAGTGTFIAGPEVAACWDADPGYYAASAVTNYGQTGSQTACPIGTYNPTSGGTSLSSCLSCTGATYNDETAQTACKSCPAGYTTNTTAGKTAENQCQLQCPNGKYNTGYSRVEYLQSSGSAYINTFYAFKN